jgi:hypothetical protein
MMKNLTAMRPRAQELNEAIRQPEDILKIRPARLMVEPKFDGSFVYVTRDPASGHATLCTRDGNELRLEPAAQNFILHHFERFTEHCLFEAELEPLPWSEANKVALNGNLYARRSLPFRIRLVVHDVLPLLEVERPHSTARERYVLLQSLAGIAPELHSKIPMVWSESEGVLICITPCWEFGREEAMQLFQQGWAAGKPQRRVDVYGQEYEGLVLIDPDSMHTGGRANKWKVKPFHTQDICVTGLEQNQAGKVPVRVIYGYDTKTGETVKITSGVSPAVFSQVQHAQTHYSQVIVEVEVSSLRALASANPTLLSIRFDRMESLKPVAADQKLLSMAA